MKLKNRIKILIGNISIKLSVFLYCHRTTGLVGKCLFVSFKHLLALFNISVYPVVNALLYKSLTGNMKIVELEKCRRGVSGNIIMAGNDDPVKLVESELPDITLYHYKNVCLQGNSDVIVDTENEYVISDAWYNMPNNEEAVDGLLYRTRNNVCLLRNNMKRKRVYMKAGIMVSGKFCHNFYHILYENLIRLVYLKQVDIPKDVPFIVDMKTLSIPSCKFIFEVLTKDSGREVIQVDSNKIYEVDNLFCLSRVNIFPAHVSGLNISEVEYLYDPHALKKMREQLIKYKSGKVFPRRFFITRSGSQSRHFNETEVFNILEPYGFELVAPETLTFDEQMSLFNGAEYIVGGSGAAFSNLLFVNDKSTIVIFTRGTFEEIIELPVFNTIANIAGGRVVYFPNLNVDNKNAHVNYTIDCERFSDVMKMIIK